MQYCTNCGAPVDDGERLCSSCKAEMENSSEGSDASRAVSDAAESIGNTFKEFNNTEDSTAEFDPNDIKSNKVMALLSYFSILVLIPIFAAPNSRFARFHANQGLVLAIAEIIWSVVANIVTAIIALILPFLGGLLGVILNLVSILFLVLAIIGIVNVANGQAKDLPIIGKIRILK